MADKLNFNEALSGLDFIENGEFKTDDPAEQRVFPAGGTLCVVNDEECFGYRFVEYPFAVDGRTSG